jgi:acyl carrier protein
MPTQDEIYGALTEIFRDVFMRDDLELQPGLTAKDVPGWDSFKQIEIIMATEERFGIRMTTRDLDSLQSVGDLVRVVVGNIVR